MVDHREDVLIFRDDLGRSIEIAKDYEGEVLAHRADVFHPADERDLFADIFYS